MISIVPEGIDQVFLDASRKPMIASTESYGHPVLDRTAVQKLIPHRDPFLFIDSVTLMDRERNLIAARYDLARGKAVFAGHFPSRPVWPAVLQVEAIGQAGLVLYTKMLNTVGLPDVVATHILGARFLNAVPPGEILEINASLFEDGLFCTIVGQCLCRGVICSAAAVRTII
jgi:3-hydroxyacyl-[acyl-carrier-protein] dehydratase